jgi:hypothetical protein
LYFGRSFANTAGAREEENFKKPDKMRSTAAMRRRLTFDFRHIAVVAVGYPHLQRAGSLNLASDSK